MRIILFLCISVLVLNCEDKQSKKKTNTNVMETKDSLVKIVPKDTVQDAKGEFPVLDDKNAIPFFAEYDKKNKENKVRIFTDFGDVDILLYNDTKYHRSNFIYLTKRHYFDGTQFYRVIKNYIVQAGNSDDEKIAQKRFEIGKYLLPTDTKKGYTHHRGVISMPSSDIDNPYKLASPYEFFIVLQKGGADFLDGEYTIFGEVTKGMEVLDKIAAVDTDSSDWPLKNIYIRKVEIIE
ncbi:peptidylprolyl isomerase [Confluentibacter sediminis]|uniref:peptidylprolyl isomerase n=1 Tax=Confluentibacter sediminis TaxID=2219045 RepID=UPI000DAF2370|nr:peptidylprolyl isomerase [Confluentibacter sediminis]